MANTNVQYLGDDGVTYRISIDALYAALFGFEPADESFPILPSGITPRVIIMSSGDRLKAVPARSPIAGTANLGQTISIDDENYECQVYRGESGLGDFYSPGAIVAGRRGLQGLPGMNGPAGADGRLMVANFSVSSSEILNLYTTPKNLIAAPGANKVIVPVALFARHTAGTVQYTAGGVLGLQSWNSYWTGNIPKTLITGAGAGNVYEYGAALNYSSNPGGDFDKNKALQLANLTGPFLNGNGTLRLWVWYDVIDVS